MARFKKFRRRFRGGFRRGYNRMRGYYRRPSRGLSVSFLGTRFAVPLLGLLAAFLFLTPWGKSLKDKIFKS